MRRSTPRRGVRSPRSDSPPTATPETPSPSSWGLPTTSPVSGSSRVSGPVRVRSSPRSPSAPAASRSGALPIAIGAETSAPSSPSSRKRTAATIPTTKTRRAGSEPAGRAPAGQPEEAPLSGSAHGGRARCGSLREDRGRPHLRALGARGRRRSAPRRSGSGRRAPWRPRADHLVHPLRQFRLGLLLAALRRGRSRSAPRRGRSRASRRRPPGPTSLAAPLLRRHVLGGADDRGAAARRRFRRAPWRGRSPRGRRGRLRRGCCAA